jgi:hypothetical protein
VDFIYGRLRERQAKARLAMGASNPYLARAALLRPNHQEAP